MKNLCFLILVAIVAACGTEEHKLTFSENLLSSEGIFGGKEVSSDHFLAVQTVGLLDEKNGSKCTGSLIAEDLVLTAAHCVFPSSGSITVFFSNRVSSQVPASWKMTAFNFQRHPSFHDRTGVETHDLALIRLPAKAPAPYRAVTLNSNFVPFARPTSQFVAIGFGISNRLFGSGGGVLRTLTIPFKSSISRTEFTTPQSPGGVCSGDSGGPLFTQEGEQWVQVGVASRTQNNFGPCSGTAVFTRVDMYQDWIREASARLRGH